MKKIVIAGGTGFLGRCLIKHYAGQDVQIVVLTRRHQIDHDHVHYEKWDGRKLGAWMNVLNNADVLINLNGKSVDCRYTEENKQLIYDTRIDATRVLGDAVRRSPNPPKVWINASSATIYRHSVEHEMDEYTGEIGSGFSVDVCRKWEQAFNECDLPFTRKIITRIGIVMGNDSGPFSSLVTLIKSGLGGSIGAGDQYVSWIHEKDFVRMVDFLVNNDSMKGVFNVTSPVPVPNRSFMKALRHAFHIPFGLPIRIWMLEWGAWLKGTESELMLKSRRVIPRRFVQAGYKFKFETIQHAAQDLAVH